ASPQFWDGYGSMVCDDHVNYVDLSGTMLGKRPFEALYDAALMVAQEPGTNPAKAIDYCSSAAMARTLMKICRDVTCFSLYEQACFAEGERLHDYRKGADRFRHKDMVYEVLCERVLYGGDVLPPHVARWYNSHGRFGHYAYMETYGSDHMIECYDVYEKQAFEATQALITPVPYQIMIAYHRYTTYLPITMFFRAVLKKKALVEAIVKDMVEKGFTIEQLQTSLVADDVKHMLDLSNSVEGKKKRRRFARA
ncbi:unnamed protein product, partial [Ectocarpus sp. 12 AP-2014]